MLTVFSTLETLKVWDAVMVVTIEGRGKYVVATVKALVGKRGVQVFAVIFVGGTGCMGAYLVKPDWREYGTALPESPAPAPASFVI